MKKILSFFIFVLLGLAAICQLQRLAVLPPALRISGQGESLLSSLCLDYFRTGPGFDDAGRYAYYTDAAGTMPDAMKGAKIKAESFDRVSIENNSADALKGLAEALFTSAENDLEAVSRQKRNFVNSRIAKYKNKGSFTEEDLGNFQDDIWAFDILESLGYVAESKSAEEAYSDAQALFADDFLEQGVRPSPAKVHKIGDRFTGYTYESSKLRKDLLLFRSKRNANVIVFDGLNKPLYRGTSLDELAKAISTKVNTGDIVEIGHDGFVNELKEKTFYTTLQRKLRINYKKDVILSTDRYGIVWEKNNYTISQGFSEANIRQQQVNGKTLYGGSVKVKTKYELWNDGVNVTIEGQSNKRTVISRFFQVVTGRIRAAKEAFELGWLSRRMKKEVMQALNLTNEDFLDVILITEGGAKDVIRIRKQGIVITHELARQ